MKAAVYTKYGPPELVQLKEVEKPTIKDNEVLIKIHATTVTSADWRARTLSMPPGFGPLARLMFGISGPRKPILGIELAGQIASVGKSVTKFKVNNQVFAMSGIDLGCHAEYKRMPEDGAIAFKPTNLSYEQAAVLSFGGTTALDYLRDRAKIQKGEKILINGASGAVGTAAVQLAKHFGAEVTGVCSTANLALVTSLGANQVIDYTKENFVKNGKTYDIILDTVGTVSFSHCQASLKKGGRLLLIAAGLPQMLLTPWVSMTSTKKIIVGPARERAEDLQFLAKLAEMGQFKPIIDRSYPFEQIANAHAYVESRHKRGNVAITLKH